MQNKVAIPPLAYYRSLSDYIPKYGDFIIWTGWFTTWHGIISGFDAKTAELSIIFASVPFILFTLNEDEQTKETKVIKLQSITQAPHGKYAILQHNHERNANIWYL